MTTKTKFEVLTEQTKKFCYMMAEEMGEDPETVVEGKPLWMKYMPMAMDHFLADAYSRVRQKFWDEEKAAQVRLLNEMANQS